MPRQAAVPPEDVVNVLSGLNIFNEYDKLKPRADPIWAEACTLLSNKVKPHALHISILQNRNNMCTHIRENKRLPVAPTRINTSAESECNSSNDRSLFDGSNKKGLKDCPDLFFNIILDHDVWRRIAPKEVFYKEKVSYGCDRRYYILNPGWTNEIAKACWDVSSLPCAYSFKRAKVYENETGLYLTIDGTCKECGASLYGHCPKKPDPDSGIKIYMKTIDTRGIPHVEKRYLKGPEREAVGEELLRLKACEWRRNATKVMDYGDAEPAHLYSSQVLRKARQEAKDKQLGLHNVQDPLISVRNMKYHVEFAGIIREIGMDKFYCMYWSPLQLDLYKDARKKELGPLSIDATGSVVRKIPKPNGESSGAIFLYQATLPGVCGTWPVFQMMSEKHDTNTITYWLREWLRSGASIPKEVVTDFSLALLNGVCLAFDEKSLQSYVSTCYAKLGDQEIDTPHCFVRVDVAHLMNLVSRWKCFQGKHGRVKDFYLRCVALMTTCSENSAFEDLLLSVFVVAISECDGNDDCGKETDCQYYQTLLLNKIRLFNVELSNPENEFIDEAIADNDNYFDGDIVANIERVRCAAECMANKALPSQRMNPYHLLEIVQPLTKLARFFPLWTNVMMETFGSSRNVATSARSEAYFNNLKNYILADDARPLRLDKFLTKHMRSILCDCKLQRAAFDREGSKQARRDDFLLESTSKEKYIQSHDNSVSTSFLSEEENWRGRNTANVQCVDVIESKETLKRGDTKKIRSLNTNREEKENVQNTDGEKDKRIKKKLNEEYTKSDIVEEQMSSKKRGRYLEPCPDINLIHSRPLRRRKNAIIQNGSMLPPIKMGSVKMQFLYTCPFDSIVEILSTAYLDCATYKAAIDDKLTDLIFFRIVVEYATNGVSKNLYYERALLLSTIFSPDNGVTKCSDNIHNMIAKLLTEFPSAVQTSICNICEITTAEKVAVLDVNAKSIMKNGIRASLQQAISDSLADKLNICQTCNNRSLSLTRQPGIHIFVDVEHIYEPFLIDALGQTGAARTVAIDDIPASIIIGEDRFTLRGIVVFTKPPPGDEIGHYRAFCRRVVGSWEEHDSLKRTLQVLESKIEKNVNQLSIVVFTRQ